MAARFRVIGLVALAAAFAVPSAGARPALLGLGSSNCPSSGTQAFSAWGDSASYYPASNGGFESGSSGWSLKGNASVVSGNEPFFATGSHSLSLGSGSSATSPVLCLDHNDPYVRIFGTDTGGVDGGLHVRVTWYGLLNTVLGITDFTTYAPGSGWAPLAQLNSSGGGNVLIPLLGSTSARIEFTPVGSGSDWQIDDLFVDPWAMRG